MDRDRRNFPLTAVEDMDSSTHAVRHINLPPQEAVMYAMASDLGAGDQYHEMKDHTFFLNGAWICGRYRARQESVSPPKKNA